MAMEAAGEVESLHRPVGMKDGNEVMLLEKIADTGGAEEKILDHLLLTELIKELKKTRESFCICAILQIRRRQKSAKSLNFPGAGIADGEKDPENHAGTRKRIKGCMFSGKTGILFPI